MDSLTRDIERGACALHPGIRGVSASSLASLAALSDSCSQQKASALVQG